MNQKLNKDMKKCIKYMFKVATSPKPLNKAMQEAAYPKDRPLWENIWV